MCLRVSPLKGADQAQNGPFFKNLPYNCRSQALRNDRKRKDLEKRKILFVDDDPFVLESFSNRLKDEGFDVVAVNKGADAISAAASERNFDVIIADIRMPDIDGIQTLAQVKQILPKAKSMLLTAFADYEAPIRAIHVGVDDYIMKPVEDEVFFDRIKKLIVRKAIEDAITEHYGPQPKKLCDIRSIIGNSEPSLRILYDIKETADNDASVLLIGETGTGKELVAQAIHSSSARRDHNFIAINCAAIAETLAEDEFFGHEKGAFSNADSLRIGKFELAQKGTIFLDEIGKLDYKMQDKLLRVLEEKKLWRLGGHQEIHLDVRVIAAMQNSDSLKKEMYHRFLKTIQLPSLQERREDIPLLAMHFMERYNVELKKNHRVTSIEDGVMQLLLHHDWEGNVRELRNVIGCAVMSAREGVIRIEDLRLPQPSNPIISSMDNRFMLPKEERLESIHDAIKKYIEFVLSQCPTKVKAAKILELPPATLNDWIKKYNVELPPHLRNTVD